MRVLFLSKTVMTPLLTSMGIGPLTLLDATHEEMPEMTVTWAMRAYGMKTIVPLRPWIEFALIQSPTPYDRFMAFRLTEEMVEQFDKHDLILSCHLPAAQMIRELTDTPLLNFHLWTGTRQYWKEAPTMFSGEFDLISELIGTLFAPNVWESTRLKTDVAASLAPHTNAKIEGDVLPLGVMCDRLDEVYQARKERSEPVLFWGGDIDSPLKGFAQSYEVMTRAMAVTGAKGVATTHRPKSTMYQTEWPQIEVFRSQNVYDFHERMKGGDVFVCNSSSESYGLAWLEMLGAGLLGVYGDSYWTRSALPEWYPFVTSDLDEQAELVTALLRQYPDGPLWRYADMTREWVRENHDERLGGKVLATKIRELTR